MDFHDDLERISRADLFFMAVLRAVRGLDLPDWAVSAGIIRNLVWDHLHR